MKTVALILVFILLPTACGGGGKINGRTLVTANKSMKSIKEKLPEITRLEYELSYWTLRDEFKDDIQFLGLIDGKNPFELIDAGQESFNRRKASGFAAYQNFADWEAMLNQYKAQRSVQAKTSVNAAKEASYKHSVIYNPRYRN